MHKLTLAAWPTWPAQLWISLACFYLWVHVSFTPCVSLPFMFCYLCSLLQLCTCLRCVTSCLSLLFPPVRCLYVFFSFSYTQYDSCFHIVLNVLHFNSFWYVNSPLLNPHVQRCNFYENIVFNYIYIYVGFLRTVTVVKNLMVDCGGLSDHLLPKILHELDLDHLIQHDASCNTCQESPLDF